MFKKPPAQSASSAGAVSNQNALSGKDVKSLIESILHQYPTLEKTDLKDSLGLHSKASVIRRRMTFGSNKVTLYEVIAEEKNSESGERPNGVPLLFEIGHGKLFPTVFAMWRLPGFCPAVDTWSAVSTKVIAGADLMLPGVITPFSEPFDQGTVRCIRVQGNPFPFAVGEMAVSSKEAEASGMKGKGVIVLHHCGDELWVLGGKTVPDTNSFLGNQVLEVEEYSRTSVPLAEDDGGDAVQPKEAIGSSTQEEELHPSSRRDNQDSDVEWMSDMNELIDQTFVQALHKIKDENLPIDTKVFYEKYLLPNRPKGTSIELAKTRYKKLGKLIQQMKKKGLIGVEEMGNDTEAISKINRKNATYRDHQLWPEEDDQVSMLPGEQGHEKAGKEAVDMHAKKSKSLEIFEVYAATTDPIKHVLTKSTPMFVHGKRDVSLLTDASARAALAQYIKDLNLADSLGVVQTHADRPLRDALFQNSKKIGDAFPERLSFEDTWSQIRSHMIKYHVICRTGQDPIVKKGEVRPVRITIDKRQGGRNATTILLHLERFGIDAKQFAKSCQKRFAAAATVIAIPGEKDVFAVQIQGDLLNEIRELLMSDEYGLSKHHMTVSS